MKPIHPKSSIMKKLLPLLLLLLSGMVKAQIVNIPDPHFKAYLLSASFTNNIAVNSSFISSEIDTNNDNEIQESEAAAIIRLWISDDQIADLQGIEAFTNLTELTVYGTSITSFGVAIPNLSKLQCTLNPMLTTADISGMTGLTQLDCNSNASMTSINVQGCTNLTSLAATGNILLSSLDVSGLASLVNLYCYENQLTSLNVSGCTNLQGIVAANNPLTAIDVSGLTNLIALDASYNANLTSLNAAGCIALDSGFLNLTNDLNITDLNLSNCTSLTIFAIVNTSLNQLDVTGCTNLNDLQVQNNQLETLVVDGCTSLATLGCSSNQLTSLDLSDCQALQYLFSNNNAITDVTFGEDTNLEQCTLYNNQLTALDFSGMTNLIVCQIENNPIITLDISGCTSLDTMSIPDGLGTVTTINAQGCTSMSALFTSSPVLQSLNILDCPSLHNLVVSVNDILTTSPISSIDLTGAPNLTYVSISNTSLASIDLSANGNLTNLTISSSPITSLDLSALSNLTALTLDYSLLESVDISNQQNLNLLSVSGCPQLTTIFAKNGKQESFSLNSDNTSLQFICQDAEFLAETQDYIVAMGLGIVCNSYCTATPGGDFNIISGLAAFDADNNGCDGTDAVQPNMKISINDGSTQGATFTDAAGHYVFYTPAGDFDVSLGIENPSLFAVTTVAPVVFADDNNNTAFRDFCINAIGIQNDIEIVIAPISPARPGFSAIYQIVIKNKGNQTMNGSFSFAYDETVMDFVVATTAVSSQSTGMLNWNYSDLLPFENQSIYVLMNVNSPTQTPPVNQDDVLEFTATANPIVNDINAPDNQFVYQQTVVNSFDPNDITCMQGETLSPQDIGKYLHYVINFENTGTYAAEQVVVKVVIDDTRYDINSLQLLNTSHNVRPVIKGNTAEFFFEGINLAAAAGDPPVGGHGNILFKVRTLSTLVTGDEVISKADIFFDYNFPIETNEARSVFQTLSAPGVPKDESITLYPNPAKDFMTIECDNIIRSVSIYDVQGRVLEILKRESNAVTLDVSNRANGMYFVKIMTDKGMQVQKVVKE